MRQHCAAAAAVALADREIIPTSNARVWSVEDGNQPSSVTGIEENGSWTNIL